MGDNISTEQIADVQPSRHSTTNQWNLGLCLAMFGRQMCSGVGAAAPLMNGVILEVGLQHEHIVAFVMQRAELRQFTSTYLVICGHRLHVLHAEASRKHQQTVATAADSLLRMPLRCMQVAHPRSFLCASCTDMVPKQILAKQQVKDWSGAGYRVHERALAMSGHLSKAKDLASALLPVLDICEKAYVLRSKQHLQINAQANGLHSTLMGAVTQAISNPDACVPLLKMQLLPMTTQENTEYLLQLKSWLATKVRCEHDPHVNVGGQEQHQGIVLHCSTCNW